MPTPTEVCDALCGVLRRGNDVHRCFAAQALGRIGGPRAVDALIACLGDEDEDVRVDAAWALGRAGEGRAGAALLDSLIGDPCNDVKLNAIGALARMRDRQAVPWLRRLLRGRDEAIVWDDSEFYDGGWDDWLDIQVRALQALADMGVEEAVPEIVEAIDDELGQDLTDVGFTALARLGRPGIEALAGYLDRGNEGRRQRAASALAGPDAEVAGEAVVRALRDPSKDVRLAAARALAARDPSDRRLAALLWDDEPEVRAQAVRLCGRQHPNRMDSLLDEKAPVVQRAVLELAAEAPELLSADGVVEKVRSMLRGSAPQLAASAATTLAVVAPSIAGDDLVAQLADVGRPLDVRVAAVRGLTRLGGEKAARALAEVLGDDQRQVRLEALAALAAMAGAEKEWPNLPGRALLAALRGELVPEQTPEAEAEVEAESEPNEGARNEEEPPRAADFPTSTLQSIAGGDGPSAELSAKGEEDVELTEQDIEFLALSERTLRKRRVPVVPHVAPGRDVRRFAARVLGDLARDEVARELATSLNESDKEVRLNAADSLARIGERMTQLPAEVVDALLEALAGTDRDSRLSIVRALGAAGGQEGAEALIEHLRDSDSFVRAEAIRALSKLGKAAEEVEALLQDADAAVRLAAAEAVAEVGGAKAVDLLVDFAFAFAGYHRREAGRLLRQVDAQAANARFVDVLDDRNRMRAWQVAIEALEELNHSALMANDRTIV